MYIFFHSSVRNCFLSPHSLSYKTQSWQYWKCGPWPGLLGAKPGLVPSSDVQTNSGSSTRVQSRNNRLICFVFFSRGLSGNSALTSQSSLNLFENEYKVTASGPQQYKKLLSNNSQCLTVHWVGSSKMFQTRNDQRKIWQQEDEVVVVAAAWQCRSQRKTNKQLDAVQSFQVRPRPALALQNVLRVCKWWL